MTEADAFTLAKETPSAAGLGRLLVIDSATAHVERLIDLLAREGFHVSSAGDPAVASVEDVDCVLVNLQDPRFDGVEACRKLADKRAAGTVEAAAKRPFLIAGLSDTRTSEGVVKAAFRAGADDVLSMSSDAELVGLRLRALMPRQAMRHTEDTRSRSATEHFRILVQSVVDYAIYMLDAQGHVSTWNAGAERIKGYSTDEIIGQHFSRFYTTQDRAGGEPERALERARSEGRYEAEAERLRKDGSRFWAHVVIDPIFATDGSLLGYAKITRDITERRKAAEELQATRTALMQSQKMEAIGQLTGGIAHDFNNMLAGIIGGLNLIQRRIADRRYEEAGNFIEAALNSANRAASLTKRLLAFGRRQTLDIRPVELGEAIGSMRILLDRTMGENVKTEMRFETGEILAATDIGQLESAILNLAINARDAMPEGGTLTISTRPGRRSDHPSPALSGPADSFVVVSVKDTGIGMPADIVQKVFEPFFTTKPIGQGTGLGLSMVYGFVSQSGGHVQIESAVGLGTTVTIWLPASSKAAVAPESPRAVSDGARGTGETVLVVEDDPQVRMMILAVLKDLNYLAIEASDPDQALAIIEADRRIDLLVTDVGLPRIDGRVLARLARSQRPDLRVLFITGYAQHASVRTEFIGEGMDILMKPFSLDVLAAKIREMTR